jgi:DNA mismatch endonuclease (patch repair protein)
MAEAEAGGYSFAMPRVPSYKMFTPSSTAASRVMRANVREGGQAERLLRKALWRLGVRYRKQVQGLPGRPDIVLSRAKVCVFCDGDFWHGRDWARLRRRLARRANPGYWIPKIARNIERDAEQTRALEAAGWVVIRLWEIDVLRNPDAAAHDVLRILTKRGYRRVDGADGRNDPS